MRAGIVCCVILLGPWLAAAAEQELQQGEKAAPRARALEALERKRAEAQKLQREIENLQKVAAAPGPAVRLRVRVFVASLEKIKQRGLSWPPAVGGAVGDATGIEEQLTALLASRNAAKLMADESLSVIEGTEGRVRAGGEFPAERLIQAKADHARFAFHGTEVVATPRTENDGRLAIELVCRQFRPILYSNLGPQLRIQEISTVVKLAPEEAVVIEGAKQEFVASTVTKGVSKTGEVVRQMSNTAVHHQTFIVVSRDSPLADKAADATLAKPSSSDLPRQSTRSAERPTSPRR